MLTAVGNSQNLQVVETQYPSIAASAAFTSPVATKQLLVHSIAAYNAAVAGCDVGLGIRLSIYNFKVYQQDGTDITTAIQAGISSQIFSTTNNSGVIVQAKGRFGLVTLQVSQASAGSPVFSYEYWNGTSWSALPLRNTTAYTVGYQSICFAPPIDWQQGNDLGLQLTSTTVGYCIRVRGTTAPSTAVLATGISLAHFWSFRYVGGKAALGVSFESRPKLLEAGESIQAYFSTANALNTVEIAYQVHG